MRVIRERASSAQTSNVASGIESATLVDKLTAPGRCMRYGARFVNRAGPADFYAYDGILNGHAPPPQRCSRAAWRRRSSPSSCRRRSALRRVPRSDPRAPFRPRCIRRCASAVSTSKAARTARCWTRSARGCSSPVRIGRRLGRAAAEMSSLENRLDVTALANGEATAWTRVSVAVDAPAFLQFSSGTTVEPKAVMVSHRNALANLAMIVCSSMTRRRRRPNKAGSVGCDHDMGLLGCMLLGRIIRARSPTSIRGLHRAAGAVATNALAVSRAVSPAPDFGDSAVPRCAANRWLESTYSTVPNHRRRGMERFARALRAGDSSRRR